MLQFPKFQSALIRIACLGCLLAGPVHATTWDIEGFLETCDPTACSLAGIVPGQTFIGFLKADSAASGPNSAFTEADITNYLLSSDGLSVGPGDGGTIDSATLATGPDGELISGTVNISGEIDTGILGTAPLTIVVDMTLRRFTITTTFLGLGEVGSGPFTPALEPDGDDLAAIEDNCTEVANVTQLDTDGDGYGNLCDPDFNNNGIVDPADFSLLKSLFGQTGAPDQDLNGNGIVDPFDFSRLKAMFGQPPGPTGLETPPPAASSSEPPTLPELPDPTSSSSAAKGSSQPATQDSSNLR